MTEEGGRLEEVLRARRESLERLRARGVEPFALHFQPTDSLAQIRERHSSMPPDQQAAERVRVAGRIVLLRRQGKLTFASLRDVSGDLQLYVPDKDLGPDYSLVDELDLGDIVGAEGPVMTTKRGELSIRVEKLTLLTKALRPLPEKWHGLRDAETRYRQRYLDFATNPESRKVVWARAAVLRAIRAVLAERG